MDTVTWNPAIRTRPSVKVRGRQVNDTIKELATFAGGSTVAAIVAALMSRKTAKQAVEAQNLATVFQRLEVLEGQMDAAHREIADLRGDKLKLLQEAYEYRREIADLQEIIARMEKRDVDSMATIRDLEVRLTAATTKLRDTVALLEQHGVRLPSPPP
jgi:predicted  nucleic acid-binding Zn-ribbon protein